MVADPGHAAGNQTYPPVAPDCTCGHPQIMHRLYNRKYRDCGVGIAKGPCDCRWYYPKET